MGISIGKAIIDPECARSGVPSVEKRIGKGLIVIGIGGRRDKADRRHLQSCDGDSEVETTTVITDVDAASDEKKIKIEKGGRRSFKENCGQGSCPKLESNFN